MCADIYFLQLLQNSQGRQNGCLPQVQLVHSQYPRWVTSTWRPMAIHCPHNLLVLLVKITSLQLDKFFTRVPITFPNIYSSDPYIQAKPTGSWRQGPPCSVQLSSWCHPVWGQAHSCFNTAVSMWILRKAGFVRHGVRRENRIISRRARTPCVRVTRWILFKKLTEVQVFLKEGKRDVLFHLGSG